MTKQEQLALDIERALEEYLGVPCFTGEEFPALAQAFAAVVHRAQHIHEGNEAPSEVAWNAQEYARALASFMDSLAKVVE